MCPREKDLPPRSLPFAVALRFVMSREPGSASPSLSLEDTSPPWSADAARPECGHYWRRPRDSEPPGHEAHRGPVCRVAEITQEIPVGLQACHGGQRREPGRGGPSILLRL